MDPARRRRKQRHRAELMSGFAVITLAALLVVGLIVVRMNKLPGNASLSAASSSVRQATVTDSAAGLSYLLLPSPWRDSCPMLDNPVRWSSGEGAKAGQVTLSGHALAWYANACSGVLPERLLSKNLAGTAQKAAAAINTDRALPHHRTMTGSAATTVGGRPAWEIQFDVQFPDAHGEHLVWSSEAAAVVVVDRGNGQPPAVFYVSVPGNLGTSAVRTLISSLR